MNVLALCAGIGGLELGIKLANPSARCVCYVEGEAYAASRLVERMAEEGLDEAPVWSDIGTFDGIPWRGKVDCVTGGYPCQPFSKAGKKGGESDPRHLWPQVARIVRECRPGRCFFENVAGHLSVGFEAVGNDLCGMGFKVAAGLFSAEEVGAGHGRQRLFIMADAASDDRGEYDQRPSSESSPDWADHRKRGRRLQIGTVGDADDDPARHDLDFPPLPADLDRWATLLERKPSLAPTLAGFCGVADGVPGRVDRLRCVGNAVVPLVAAYAWKVLEDSLKVAAANGGVVFTGQSLIPF